MAEYFDVDPVIMRIIWVAAGVLTGGLAIPAYIVMWLIMPRDEPSAEGWRPPAPPAGVVSAGTAGRDPWGAPRRDAWAGTPRDAWGGTPVEVSGAPSSEGPERAAAEPSAAAASEPWATAPPEAWSGARSDAPGASPDEPRGGGATYATVGATPAGEGAAAETSGQPSGRGLTPEEEELLRPVTPPPPEMLTVDDPGRKRRAAGVLLIGLGAMFFAQQLGIFLPVRWDLLWPLAIVGVGIFILTRHGAGRH
jgi:phage shock protein C